MYDYRESYRRIKRNFHYYKGDPAIRLRTMQLLRILNGINNGRSVESSAELNGVRRQYFYFWLRRLIAADYDLHCLKGYSKRPHHSPNATSAAIIAKAKEIRKIDESGGHTIALILRRDYGISIAGSTVCSILKREGVSKVYRYQKRNEHTKRYSAENPLNTVQTDSAWTGFEDNHGNRVYYFPVIDDCSRVATVHVCDSKTGDEAVQAMQRFIHSYGKPDQVQTDNGVEFTNRFTSRRNAKREKDGTYALFEQFLFTQAIPHRLIKVRTPEHNGKVERFNATLKRFLQRRARDGMTLAEFQTLIDDYLKWYNRRRPHWSLNGLTPHERFYGVRLAKIA
jgi:transposase InsO family protein